MATLVAGTIGKAVAAKATEKVIDKATEKKPAAPAVKPPPVIPDEEEQRRARRKAAALRFGAGSGRTSTVLSDSSRLGG